MTDKILEAIQCARLNRANISFDSLRQIAGRDNDCWGQLGRGRAILNTSDQLDQYLYSYGLMTKSQWSNFLPSVALPNGTLRLTDYGCGQGLGTALLFDHFGPSLTARIAEVRLIEPSTVALKRAKAVVDCYLWGSLAIAFNKELDNLSPDDTRVDRTLPHVHLLSNVLDIDGFDHEKLFSRIFANVGSHVVLAVSHDRDFQGGSGRFEQLETEIKKPEHSVWLSVLSSSIRKFNCANGQPAISWDLRVEVLSGSV